MIKKGDKVTVISGDDKGKTGEVLRVLVEKSKVVVEGVNIVKKHVKKRDAADEGIVSLPAPIFVSKVKRV